MLEKISQTFILDTAKAGAYLPFFEPRTGESPRKYLDRIVDENYAHLNAEFIQEINKNLDQLSLSWEHVVA